MKLLLYSFVFGVLICGYSSSQIALSQNTANTGTLLTGFAVVTPVSGTGNGLSVSETFGQQVGGTLSQASVFGSPLVTLTDVVINADPATGLNTGIAIVNPNATPAGIILNLNNQQGVPIATRTLTIGAHQQISQFVTELFLGDPNFTHAVTGLLFISSNVPIGVLALAFVGDTFTSLPVAAQLSTNSVITTSSVTPATVTTSTTSTFSGTTVTPATTFSVPGTPTFNGVPTPPTLLPIPTVTAPVVTTAITGTAAPLVTSTGQATTPGQFSVAPAVPTSSTAVATGAVSFSFVFPQVAAGVGGTGAVLLAQVATGGGWSSRITITNASRSVQTVRVDFFNPSGGPLPVSSGSNVQTIVIPPGGVATINV